MTSVSPAGAAGSESTHIRQKELAARLGLSTRQVQNLSDAGMPRRSVAGKVDYPWPAALHWYIQHRIDAERPADAEAAKTRKLVADAMLAEIELATKRGTVIPVEVHEKVVGDMADRLRAVCINLPGNYALHLERLGVESGEAQAVLERVADDLVQALRGVADALEEDAPDADAGEGADA